MMKKIKLFDPPEAEWRESNFDTKMKAAKEFDCYSKFGMLGFSIDSNIIKLDENNFVKRVSLKERKEFYGTLDKEGRKGNIQDYISHHQFMLFHHYRAKRLGIMFPEERMQFGILAEMFFRIFLDIEVSFKYDKDYIKDPKSGDHMGMSFGTAPRKDFIINHPPEKLPFSAAQLIKKSWKFYNYQNIRADKSLQIIISRFYHADQRLNNEDAIIDLMIALEALYLNENSELNYRLALRVSKFLEPDADKELVHEFLKKAYVVRSKVAHGSYLSSKHFQFNGLQYDLNHFVSFLKEILRLSLIRYFMEFKSVKIVEFQKIIDQAIVTSSSIQSR